MRSLFEEPHHKFYTACETPQRPSFMDTGEAEKAFYAWITYKWGFAVQDFKAKLPFNGMMQVYAAFEKRPHRP